MEELNLTPIQPSIPEPKVRWFSRQIKFSIWFPIVLITAFAAGYLFWQKTLIPGPYDLEPVAVVRHQTIESLDTSGWQTYRNEKYGFEVGYPGNWTIKNDDMFGIILVSPETQKRVEDNYKNCDSDRTNDVSPGGCIPELPNFDIRLSLSENNKSEIDIAIEFKDSSKLTEKIINKINWFRFFELDLFNSISYGIKTDNKNIIFSTFASEAPTNISSGEKTLTQILSTFKFIEPGSKEDKICIQVITKAKNPQTGEVRDFPTPCDVPEGWVVE